LSCRAVAADEADPRAGRQRDGRPVEEQPLADAVAEFVQVEHAQFMAIAPRPGKVGCLDPAERARYEREGPVGLEAVQSG
jgi:hypothetical protein